MDITTTTSPRTTDEIIADLDRRLGRSNSVTREVTYSRKSLLIRSDGVEVWTVESSFGTARGLIWVEDGTGPGSIMEAGELRKAHPEVERRETDR